MGVLGVRSQGVPIRRRVVCWTCGLTVSVLRPRAVCTSPVVVSAAQVCIRTDRGIPAMVGCMAAHVDSAAVAANACRALANLAANAENQVWKPCGVCACACAWVGVSGPLVRPRVMKAVCFPCSSSPSLPFF